MGMEAVSQIKRYHSAQAIKPSFSFRNVNISTALVIQDGDQDTELFTMMYPEKISTTSASGIWYTFYISSVQSGISVSHCSGSISVTLSPIKQIGSSFVDAADYDKWTMGRWYEKLANEGLRFGPTFQTLTSMKTEKERIQPEALSTCRLYQRVSKSAKTKFPGTFYAVHPLVVDACLQAAIMGGTAGRLAKLRAFLPVFFENIQITTPDADRINSEAFIHSYSVTTGFATKRINATLRDEEDNVLIDMSNVRLSLYSGKLQDAANALEQNRHPTLRVIWKPDITRLDPTSKSELDAYLEQFLSDHYNLTENNAVGVMAGLIDLAGHKNPRIRVLEVDRECDCKSRQWLDILNEKSDFPRVRDWHSGNFIDGELMTNPHSNPSVVTKVKLDGEGVADWDLLLLPQVSF